MDMLKKKCFLPLFVAAAWLMGALPSVAQVSSTPSVSDSGSASDNADTGDYSLKGSAVGTPSDKSAQSAASPYSLSGTGFTGQRSSQQVIRTAPVPANGAPIKTGYGVFYYPSVFSGIGYNDNVLSTPDNKTASAFLNVSPELVAEMKNRGDRYTASFSGNMTDYFSSRDDNYANYEAWLAGDNYFSQRVRTGWKLGYISGSDPRGTTQRAISSQPDHWTGPSFDGTAIYGASSASGRLEGDLSYLAKRYNNNRDQTYVADLDQTTVAGRFYNRIGTRSMLLAEIRNTDYQYTVSEPNDTNTERRYYVGLTWEATAATTGTVKVGRMTKSFADANRPGFSGASWEAGVRWMPLSRTALDLESSKSTADPTGYGNFQINTSNSLSWNHQWTGYVTSRVSAGRVQTDYAGTTRNDTIDTLSGTVNYSVLRWLNIGIDYANTNRTSTDSTAEFKRNVVMFVVNATL
jgi:hypothetical protein